MSRAEWQCPPFAISSGRLLLLFLVGAFELLSIAANAATGQILFKTGFEASEGYHTNLDLVGQNGWLGAGSGGNGLVTGLFPQRGQQAYVGFAPPNSGDSNLFVYLPLNQNVAQARFAVTMAIADSSNTNYDDFYWAVYNRQGDPFFILDFDNGDFKLYYALDGTNSWVWSGLKFSNAVPYNLTMNLDFAANRWSATFNGATVASNKPITTINSPLNLGDIDAAWVIRNANRPGDNFMVFDDYSVSGTVPAPQLTMLGLAGGLAALRLNSTTDTRFAIEASTNLVNWVALKTNTTTAGSFDYVDNGAASTRWRFYRARWVP